MPPSLVPTAPPPVRRPRALKPRAPFALASDERLVRAVRAGDARAFEAIYERHVTGLLGFCRHMLGSAHDAEDAVQQTFVSALTDLRRSDRPVTLKPWLYTIARNRCLTRLLRSGRRAAVGPARR